MKVLKSLEQHEAERMEAHRVRLNKIASKQGDLNGIACPDCGEELMDKTPAMILSSYPPQKNTVCSKCDYVGYRHI